jgi:hypothetical protein
MGNSEQDAEQDADASDNDVSNSEERIASAHDSPGGYDD